MEEWDPELQLLVSGLASLAEGLLSLCHLVTPAWSIINGLFSFANENSSRSQSLLLRQIIHEHVQNREQYKKGIFLHLPQLQ